MAGINLWGGVVSAAKTTRRITDITINKRNVIIGSGIAAVCVGLDMAGTGNEFSDAVSGFTGGSLATAATTATFLNFNFWEDIVGVHLGTGVSLIFGGAAVGFAHKKYIKPTVSYASETKAGSAVGEAWSGCAARMHSGLNTLREKLDDHNVRLRNSITERAVHHLSVPTIKHG